MTARFPVILADGPARRASAVRPLLDAAGWPTQPLRGEAAGPALLLIDPEHPQREALLRHASEQIRAVVLPEDRALVPTLEEASLGLGLPSPEIASRVATTASLLASADDLDDLVRIIVAGARELTGASAASVMLIDPDTSDLVVWGARGGSGDALVNSRVPAGAGIAGWVVQHRRPALTNDAAADPRVYHFAVGDGFVVRNLLALPLFWRGDVLGVVEAVNREGGFAEREAASLGALVPFLGVAINHTRSALSLRASAAAAARRTQDLEGAVRERTRVIAKAKAEWEQTFDALDEPMALQDGFTIRRANRAYAQRASLPVAQVPGGACYKLLGRTEPCPGCPRATGRATGEVALPGNRVAVVTRHDLRDGGEVLRYRDVTAERALEAKLRESDRQAAVVQLAAGAAHEINNPIGFVKANLAALGGYLDELAEAKDPADTAALREDATSMLRESEQGLRRVADIIRALKSLSQDEGHSARSRVDVGASADLALREVRAAFPKASFRWLARDPGFIEGNPVRLQHAISAVLTNAFQANRDAGTDGVLVSLESLGDEVRLRILDRGRGIAPDVRPRVFEPFFTTRGVGGGVGLGLTAAQGIVSRYGGRVELNGRAEGGTEAVLVLPLAPPAEVDVAQAAGA